MFSGGGGTITLLTAQLPQILSATQLISGVARGTLTITGPGASTLTISGDNGVSGRNFRIFDIASAGNLSISGVTVSGAIITNRNGGAFLNAGTLTLTNSTISGNTTGSSGGGIYNGGTLTVTNSTISGNTTGSSGGGIYNGGTLTVTNSTISGNTASNGGGGINNSRNGGTLTISNSTLSGNIATAYGGGINNYSNSGTLTVTNCTLSGNSAPTAGGLQNNGTLDIANTIIANSTSGGDYFGGGTIGTNLNNLVQDGTLNDTTGNSSGSGDISGNPFLSSLASNGGPTKTMAFTSSSPSSVTSGGDATVSNAAPIFGLAHGSRLPDSNQFQHGC
ncbi:MAG: hypothetical protein NTZ30_18380 [Planctomycetota bacterium]|nr:hypothetical protein [Planctomycetota bacterium]